MSYWDTSALVKLHVLEADSAHFEALTLAALAVTGAIALHEARTGGNPKANARKYHRA